MAGLPWCFWWCELENNLFSTRTINQKSTKPFIIFSVSFLTQGRDCSRPDWFIIKLNVVMLSHVFVSLLPISIFSFMNVSCYSILWRGCKWTGYVVISEVTYNIMLLRSLRKTKIGCWRKKELWFCTRLHILRKQNFFQVICGYIFVISAFRAFSYGI